MENGSAGNIIIFINEATGFAVDTKGLLFYTTIKIIYLGKLQPTNLW